MLNIYKNTGLSGADLQCHMREKEGWGIVGNLSFTVLQLDFVAKSRKSISSLFRLLENRTSLHLYLESQVAELINTYCINMQFAIAAMVSCHAN